MPESVSKIVKFKFMGLCGKTFSAADYIEITKDLELFFCWMCQRSRMGMVHKDLVEFQLLLSCISMNVI